MSLLGVDLGASKLAIALFNESGDVKLKQSVNLNGRIGSSVGQMIIEELIPFMNLGSVKTIGVAVPGIFSKNTGTVWAPNIPGWVNYPLYEELRKFLGDIPFTIESDRACYISGEIWNGNAKGCRDAIFLGVGTGIGAGIIIDGRILHGTHDIAGAVGWMALKQPFENKYARCGSFEYYASGEGMARAAMEKITNDYEGELKKLKKVSTHEIFTAYANGDQLAVDVVNESIVFWGMAAANLVSIFNPEKILFGGGVFGPAQRFIPDIKKEAAKWAQPVSMQHVSFEGSALGGDAGVYGAAYLALQLLSEKKISDAA